MFARTDITAEFCLHHHFSKQYQIVCRAVENLSQLLDLTNKEFLLCFYPVKPLPPLKNMGRTHIHICSDMLEFQGVIAEVKILLNHILTNVILSDDTYDI
jgi:hypothetical protein